MEEVGSGRVDGILASPSAERRRHVEGIAAAILAYAAWGFLAPGGKLLLEYTGPWTLNFHRTWLSLAAFFLIYGPRANLRALRILTQKADTWTLGTLLSGTFILYLMSIQLLEPTMAAVLLYFAPIFIAVAATRFLGEPWDRWTIPTTLVTLAGVGVAVFEPFQGGRLAVGEGLGLLLGTMGVVFWAAYTLDLKRLSRVYSERDLTIVAFVVSGLIFFVGAAFAEQLTFDLDARSALLLAAYVLFPSVASFMLYAVAVNRAGAGPTSVLIGVELVATALVSSVLTGERFSVEELAGLAIVLAAVTLFVWHQGRIARAAARLSPLP